MRLSFNRLGIALLTPVAVAVVGYLALVGINLFDEPLKDEAKRFPFSAYLEVPHAENGYFMILGWQVAEGKDAHAAGRDAFEKRKQAPSGQRKSIGGQPQDLPLPGEQEVCQRQPVDCLGTVGADIAKFRNTLEKYKVLLARLDALARYPRFFGPPEQGDFDDPRRYPAFSDMAKLGTTHSAVLWLSGAHERALDGIASRSAIARRGLRDAGSTLDMLLFSNWLRSEIALVTEMMYWDPKIVARHLDRVSQILQPLRSEELHSNEWLRGEFAEISALVLAKPRSESNRAWLIGQTLWPNLLHDYFLKEEPLPVFARIALPLLDPLMQPAATANLLYDRFAQAEIPLAKAPASRIASERRTAALARQSCTFAVRNPVGRCYVGAADRPQFGEYIADRHELDRFLRLAAVQLELIRRNTRPEDVPAVLASFAGAIDPATRRPVKWDAFASRLWIEAMSERWKRRIGRVPGHISLVYAR